jgi:16S rRNA (guanine966-N2)-methyltransferase
MRELAPYLPGARLLELYAGSGAVGLEALSRGAIRCDFVENNPSALHALKANVAVVRARQTVRIFKRDALHFADTASADRYDIVLADPPYGSGQVDRLIELWVQSPFSRMLSIEHATDHSIRAADSSLVIDDTTVSTWHA